jgi:hypothetical protein
MLNVDTASFSVTLVSFLAVNKRASNILDLKRKKWCFSQGSVSLTMETASPYPILSGSLAKSGPLDFATKNSFVLFFVGEKGLAHTYKKTN